MRARPMSKPDSLKDTVESTNFAQLFGELVDSMFSRFHLIVNKMHAKKS
jgi:hypothetical protein